MDLLVSIVTMVGSGLSATYFSFKLNNKKESNNYLRMKLEELYVDIFEFNKFFTSNYFSLYGVVRKKITYNQHLDSSIEGMKSSTDNERRTRIEMIIHIYFPELIDDYNNYEILLSKMHEFDAQLKEKVILSRNWNVKEELQNLNEIFGEIDIKTKSILSRIVGISSSINAPKASASIVKGLINDVIGTFTAAKRKR